MTCCREPTASGNTTRDRGPGGHVGVATSAGRTGGPTRTSSARCPALLDGAGIPGAEAICSHGVAWYTRRLSGALLGALAGAGGEDLASILAAAIGETADDQRDTCDLAHVNSPQATVLIVREHRGRLDHLLLGGLPPAARPGGYWLARRIRGRPARRGIK
ncbi:hypothetical protein GCM10020358_36910 [Amorphoplanes nipponensis]|uniref:Uncharacterized protein n=1 Tax=Actinoplanes nipponensis TaxID=135950 RepID=A0A919JN62_9ACTN|nr:hypothetical protein [Actinoplanes nipponensis]GIE53863.1 hypothetical protein Ani05nite_73970 [Actinoplanes nipponensis]